MAPKKGKAAKDVVEESGSEGSEDEASEYEIEEVLNAQKGYFPGGRTGYLVSWKGYSAEHNSWQDENDMEHATALIEAYWEKKKKAKKAKQDNNKSISAPVKSKKRSESASSPPPPPPKKRGRPSKAPSETAMDVDEENDEPAPPKKVKKSAPTSVSAGPTTKSTTKISTPAKDDETELVVGNMDEYMKMPSWDHLVASIDTVEQADGGLQVYITLNSGEKHLVDASVCHKKMAEKLLHFYEGNLKWRTADGSSVE